MKTNINKTIQMTVEGGVKGVLFCIPNFRERKKIIMSVAASLIYVLCEVMGAFGACNVA